MIGGKKQINSCILCGFFYINTVYFTFFSVVHCVIIKLRSCVFSSVLCLFVSLFFLTFVCLLRMVELRSSCWIATRSSIIDNGTGDGLQFFLYSLYSCFTNTFSFCSVHIFCKFYIIIFAIGCHSNKCSIFHFYWFVLLFLRISLSICISQSSIPFMFYFSGCLLYLSQI